MDQPNSSQAQRFIRTDSAPCDFSCDDLPVPPIAKQLQRPLTPPSMLSPRPSIIDSSEVKNLFPPSFFANENRSVPSFEGEQDRAQVSLEDRTSFTQRIVADDVGNGHDSYEEDSSYYSTASEGQGYLAEWKSVDQRGKLQERETFTEQLKSIPKVREKESDSGAHRTEQLKQLKPLLSPQHSLLLERSPLSPTGEVLNPLDEGLLNLNLRMFWHWVLCFCVVNFDLELGQALECVYPPIDFSESERKNIAFSAFPDSNSAAHVGDSTFTFRMRSGHFTSELYRTQQAPPLAMDNSASMALPGRGMSTLHPGAGLPVDTDGFTYGYVFFRQQKDSEIRRGYFQKSLVVLTPHPWPGLFLRLISTLGPQYMDALIEDRKRAASSDLSIASCASKALLESACFNIAAWPPPPSTIAPEATYYPIPLDLPFLGHVTRFSFPPNAHFAQLFEAARTPSVPTLEDSSSDGSLQPIICSPGRFYRLFAGSLELLWLCWELMMMGQSLLVIAESPKACSEIVWALVELLKPIPFGGDFRPYFTIQDSDFKGIANRQRLPTTATVIGVTNPVFTKVLGHWPHVIRAARVSHSAMGGNVSQAHSGPLDTHTKQRSPTLPRPTSPSPTTTSPNSTAFSPQKHGILSSFSKTPRSERGCAKRSGPDVPMPPETCGLTDGVLVESITCKHKPYLSKDRKLIKEVVEAAIRGRPAYILDNMLRRHFMDLTERFLQPLNRYFESLTIGSLTHMTLFNARSRPEIRPFKQETFLKTIEQTPPNLPVSCKRPLSDLYRAFLMSPNFAAWLQCRTSQVFQDWRRKYLEVLCTADVEGWVKAKIGGRSWGDGRRSGGGDVECVDLLLRLRDEVVKYCPYFEATKGQGGVHGGVEGAAMGNGESGFRFVERKSNNSSSAPRPTHIDLSMGSEGWASFLCANGRNPSSPGPVGVMGGIVPTFEQYVLLGKQLEALIRVLPDDLRGSVMGKIKTGGVG